MKREDTDAESESSHFQARNLSIKDRQIALLPKISEGNREPVEKIRPGIDAAIIDVH